MHVHSGDFVRWESSSEGSNCRCTSLAAKALTTAATLIQVYFDYDSDSRDFRCNLSAWFALTVVLNRTAPATPNANTAGYAKNLVIDRNEQGANSVCVASAEHQDTQHPNVLTPNAANAAARPIKAL